MTCDDFLAAMADANHVNLDAFGRWYEQAGTPQITVRRSAGKIRRNGAGISTIYSGHQRENTASGLAHSDAGTFR